MGAASKKETTYEEVIFMNIFSQRETFLYSIIYSDEGY